MINATCQNTALGMRSEMFFIFKFNLLGLGGVKISVNS